MNKILLLPVISILLFCTPAFADFAKGWDAAQKGDYATAFKELKPLAEQGNAAAQSLLGRMYWNGNGVIQDYNAAYKWNMLAAEQGFALAQRDLGSMHFHGIGVIQDYTGAFMWFMLAAKQGDADAQYNVGYMYAGNQDAIRAHMWWNIAASQGHKGGAENRDKVVKEMTPAQLTEAQKLASECVAKSYKGC
jgi:TPR repeat protein